MKKQILSAICFAALISISFGTPAMCGQGLFDQYVTKQQKTTQKKTTTYKPNQYQPTQNQTNKNTTQTNRPKMPINNLGLGGKIMEIQNKHDYAVNAYNQQMEEYGKMIK